MTATPDSSKWNGSAVLTAAILFVLAQAIPLFVFNSPQVAWIFLAGWFLITCAVQFWGTRKERIIALATLAAMVILMIIPLAV
ncbi:hypothetical protein AB1046_08710 [Promicromonospora sp. Populi]|uniref:hypothetical protein n=1 Tax=Promicromonospora sp. Populi TaxID=3239420 RepID=UPI0034E29AC1